MTELEYLKLQIEMEEINYKLDFIDRELDNHLSKAEREQYQRAAHQLNKRYKELENRLYKTEVSYDVSGRNKVL